MSRLRTMERQLACQRAQVIITPIAEDFAEAWEQAFNENLRPPDAIDFFRVIAKAGVATIVATPLVSYLDGCLSDRRIPDPGRVVVAIVHGFSETRFPPRERCRCIAHRRLVP